MARIEWDDSYSTKNTEIDEQHQKWIEIYNELHETLMKGDIKNLLEVTISTLKAMEDYAHYHFTFEEEFMKSIGYPNIVEHKRLHKDFASQIYELNRDIREGRAVLNTQLIKLMRNWIVDHILHNDKQYAEFAKPSGG